MNDLCTDDLLRLKGTVRVGSGPYLALLQDSMTGRVRAYSERDAVDGGTVRKITRDAVYLDRGGTVTVVTKERSSGAEWAPVPPPQAHGARPSCPAPNAADEVTAMEMRPDRYGKGEMSR